MAGDTTLLTFLAKTVLGLREPKETPDVSVKGNPAGYAAAADTRSPEQIKLELIELQRAIQDEANRYSAD